MPEPPSDDPAMAATRSLARSPWQPSPQPPLADGGELATRADPYVFRVGGAVRRGLWHLRGQPLLRPAAPAPDRQGPARRIGADRPGGHRRADRLWHRLGPSGPPRGHPGPSAAGTRHPGGGRRGVVCRLRGAEHHRADRDGCRGRLLFGGRPDPGALRRVAGLRAPTGAGGGHGDERSAARHPAGPHLLGVDRRRSGMAHRLRRGRRGGAGAGRPVAPAPSRRASPAAHRLLPVAGVGGPPDAHRAGAAPPVGNRGPHLRHLQRDLDQPGFPARRIAVPRERSGDRAIRPAGGCRCPGRLLQRTPGRPGSRAMGLRWVLGPHVRGDRPAGPGRRSAMAVDRWHRDRRPGHPGRAYPEPTADLRNRPVRPVPSQYRVLWSPTSSAVPSARPPPAWPGPPEGGQRSLSSVWAIRPPRSCCGW